MSDRGVVRQGVTTLVTETRQRVGLVARTTALLWAVEIVDFVLGGRLDSFGVRPRSLEGLLGIFAAPLLHGGFGHLVANTVPFAILGFLTTARKKMDFWVVVAASTVVGGLGTWLTAPAGGVHIGASGVVFGMLGFLMGRGLFERRAGAIALSMLVTVLFGGMLWGLLPIVAGEGISWQMHLFGFLGGLLTARVLGDGLRRRRR
jgi:membrane associated rhomboid family serine protease